MFNAYNARMFSRETKLSPDYFDTVNSYARFGPLPGLLIWPAFVTHGELKKGYGFRHENYTRLAIEIPLEGNLICERNGNSVLVSPGEAGILHYGEDSSFRVGPAGFCRKIGFGVTGPLISSIEAAGELAGIQKLTLRDPDLFLDMILELERRIHHAGQENCVELSSYTFRVLTELTLSVNRKTPPLLQAAVDLMRTSLSRMTTIAEIAEKLKTSQSRLEQLFRLHLGCAPGKYFARLRLELAKELLVHTELPIGEIARRVGYVHIMHFSRRFTAVCGIAPSEYRKQKKEKNLTNNGKSFPDSPSCHFPDSEV